MKLLLKVGYRVLRFIWFFTRPITLGVRVLLIQDGQVLLVRHSYQNAWFLPGGGVKRGETLEQAVRREAMEECGAQVGDLRLVGVYSNFQEYKSDHTTLFLSTQFTWSGRSDQEIEAVAAFPLDGLPGDVSPGSRRRIEAYQRGETCSVGVW